MISSRTKNKIYAVSSILVIILIIGSFAMVANFLLEINEYIFSVDEKIVKEKTTILDKANLDKIKAKIDSGAASEKKSPSEIIAPEEISPKSEENIEESAAENNSAESIETGKQNISE